MTTLVKTWTYAKKRLEAAGIDSPTIDARILLVCALNIGRNDLITDPYREVARADIDKLNEFLARRELREPV
ncbi:MAG: release factor glutamine methyltransferase, partial [Hyphomonadaceae bacterium]